MVESVQAAVPTTHSLRSRYLYKTFGHIVNLASSVVVQMVVPRGLGVVQYGNFSFLTDFFVQFLAFFNMGSSIGFYTKLSKRQQESKLVTFYLMYIALVVLIGLLAIFLVSGAGFQGRVWPDQRLGYIYAAVIFAGLMYLTNSMNDVVDARGLTVAFEKSRVLQKIGAAGAILFLFFHGVLTMDSLFCFNYIFFSIAICFSFYIIRRAGFSICPQWLNMIEIRAYIKEFLCYSKPLAVLGVVALVLGIFDRWFLQVTGGGVEQGFYSLSFKIGALCFVFSGAMTQLLTREFSIAYGKKDFVEMGRLFRRHIPLLYGITAVMACFFVMNAGKIAVIMGGREFSSAVLPVAIMSFYPIHQTYGQLSSAVFFATEQTKLYSTVCILSALIGLPFSFFLLASPVYHGMGLGAVGLAIKMVLFNILLNNVLLYFNARFLKLSFGWYLRQQVVSVSVFCGIAWLMTASVDHAFSGLGILMRFLGAGAGYLFITGVAVYFFPALLGLGRDDVMMVKGKVIKWSRLKKI